MMDGHVGADDQATSVMLREFREVRSREPSALAKTFYEILEPTPDGGIGK